MKIHIPQNFDLVTKDKYILLDTSVFIDSSKHPGEFLELFNRLKKNNATLVTIDAVQLEFLKGIKNAEEYGKRESLVVEIIDASLPISSIINNNCLDLVKKYLQDGSTVSVTDLLLGGTLMAYKDSLLLLTKNTNDFPNNIFKFETYFHLIHNKGIQLYAIYKHE